MSALASTTVAVVTGGAVAVLVVPEPVDGVLLVYSMAR
jgi:hypothetical protein